MSKKCTRCGEEKTEGEFGLSGYTRTDGSKTLSSWCKDCMLKKDEEYRQENREQINEKMNGYYKEDPEKFRKRQKERYASDPESGREETRKWREKNKSKMSEYNRKWHGKQDRFKVALQCSKRAAKKGGYVPCSATREEIESAFTGRCAVCGVPELECSKKLVMDHSHEDGFFRGWVCRKCNSGLGFFNDNEELISLALLYLTSSKFR